MAGKRKRDSASGDFTRFEDGHYSYSLDGPRRQSDDSSDPLQDILETLYSEHRYISSLLDTLEQQAERLQPGKIPDYGLMLEIVDYLTHYPDEYHHPREDLLFGSMLESDKSFQTRLERLQREHQALGHYNRELFNTLTRIVEGRPADEPALVRTIGRYVDGYRKHMDYESRQVFPRAKGSLDPASLRRLRDRTLSRDDPLFGNRVQYRFHRIGRNLQARADIVGGRFMAAELSAIESGVEKLARLMQDIGDLEIPAPRLLKRGRARPSWQARVLNTCTRTFMKPMMRFGNIESMRTMTTSLDELQEQQLPQDINARLVSKADYEGEWVRIKGKRPRRTILYFPGGAFIMRTRTQHKSFVARICRAANCKALVVHYRLAPEVPFPGGLEDCLAAYHDLLAQGIDPEHITLAGDSAGGGLVMSTLLALRDEGSPMPANAVVLSPLGDLTYGGESRRFNKRRDPMLPTHRASQMHELYVGDAKPDDRYISPVLADFDGLPPMLGQVGSTEILLSDTVSAARQAKKAGVPFFLEIWEEMPHVFPIFPFLPESEVAVERIAEFIDNSRIDPLPARYGASKFVPPRTLARQWLPRRYGAGG